MYKLMIADDEPLIRRGIKQLIDLSSLQIGEIHEASTGEEALKVFEEFKPEIVLMDINMPNMHGLAATKEISNYDRNAKILICSTMVMFPNYQKMGREAGAKSFLSKPFTDEEFVEAFSKLFL